MIFGGIKHVEACKDKLRSKDDLDKNKNKTILTASPLDYHTFRQEVTSKYPAYDPPPPLVPLEINNNTMLPPLPTQISESTSQDDLQALSGVSAGPSSSIFHQSVHIATPAPSPPPSPAGQGGKGGKKQNYQTNQNFPFLYPPLDSTSNELGGKGAAELQDRLVGKQWQGSDIPASILEAGQLFHSRMRMSRPLRQLWDVREDFIKYERGWLDGVDDQYISEQNADTNANGEESIREANTQPKDRDPIQQVSSKQQNPAAADKTETEAKLDLIEGFYVSDDPRR